MALAALVLLVYGQTARHEFVNYDDDRYVYQNPVVTAGFAPGNVARAFAEKVQGLWTPLVTVSHMIDWRLYGPWAGGHHLTNAALHLGSVILLFLILLQMTGAPWRSAFVAALFGIHPLHVESVAWVSERKDVLSGFFFMLTLGAYLRYVRRPGSAGRYLAVLLLFAMGLMCKPMLVTLPFVLLLLDYWPLARLFRPPGEGRPAKGFSVNWRVVVEKLPLLALSVALALASVLGPKAPWVVAGEQIPFWTRMCEAPVWLVTYLVQSVWPAGLSVVYTHYEASLRWFPTAMAWLGALSLWFVYLRNKRPYLWMGWLWNLGMLMPVIGFVQISRHARADHYTYLPQIGVYIALTWTAADWAGERRSRRMALGVVAGTALGVLSIAAWRQTAVWRDSAALWTHAIEATRDNYIARTNLAQALLDQGRTREAIDQYRTALQINPDQFDAQYNLGQALFRQGSIDDAVACYHAAIEINPGSAEARDALGLALSRKGWPLEALAEYREAARLDPADPDAQYNLGVALSRQGRTEEAIEHFRAALQANPGYEAAHDNLGNAFFQQGRMEVAIAEYRAALRIDPGQANAQNNIGSALLRQGQTAEAIQHFQKALELKPGNVAILNNLASALATAPQAGLRDGARALALALQANVATGGGNSSILGTLAAAYAETGQFPRAVETAQKALALAGSEANGDLARELNRQIQLYKAGRRFEGIR